MERREEEIFRGEIYYVYPSGGGVGSEQSAGRPAIVVSNDKANQYSPVIEMVYLTTQPKNSLPTHVDILSALSPSIALCEQIHSVSKSRLGGFIAKCTDGEMAMIDGALCVSLGIELQTTSKQQKTIPPPTKPAEDGEKQALRRDVELWKGLYHGLLDKLIQAKGA